jgi:UDP-N-acetylglucosamine acyltransferase
LNVPRIDPTARVADGAQLADDVEIGPYCVVGPQVELHAGVRLLSHVNIAGVTRIGERTAVYPFASLGTPPQSTGYRGGATKLIIGADCVIREGVTMNAGTEDGGGVTQIGDRGFFMNCCHVGHDCIVGNDVVFVTQAGLAGHCVVDDHVVISGLSAAHQFTHIGAHAMISGLTGLRGDVIPFAMAVGPSARLAGINVVGMRRRQFSKEAVRAVRMAYRALFFGAGDLEQRTATVEKQFGSEPAVAQIVAFVRRKRRRPLCFPGSDEESDDE